MSWQAWMTIAVTGVALIALMRDVAADAVFLGSVVLLALAGVLKPDQAFAGFSNSAVLTVGALFVVAAGLRETGAMDFVGQRVLGRVHTELGALMVLAVALVGTSAFLNNTPIVAMAVPVVIAWCRRRQVSPSRLLIPVSFFTVLGGTCTLIGTSTNLVVQGLLIKRGMRPMGLFEIGMAGVPGAIVGVAYMLTVGRRLLPDRKELIEQLGESRREYLVEMLVQPGCRLAGQTVAEAGLRGLPGLFLLEIDRGDELLGPVEPDERIRVGDRLVFTGVVGTIVDLERIPGLVPAADTSYEVSPRERRGRRPCEAVVSPASPLVGRRIRDANFRALYNAAVVAVHRHGRRLTNKIGDIELRPGDTLLIQVGPHFADAYRNSPDFYLVSDVEGARPIRHDRAPVAALILVALVGAMSAGLTDVNLAAFAAAGLMVATRCLSAAEARRAVDWPMLVSIAAAFGLGSALESSGVARAVTAGLLDLTRPLGPIAALGAIYFATVALNELITNNGAAVLAFPFALEAAQSLGVSERPFVIVVALAASNAYASPIGYQTHMMVYGPGGYRFRDFVRVGLPLNVLPGIVALVVVPLAWPLHADRPVREVPGTAAPAEPADSATVPARTGPEFR